MLIVVPFRTKLALNFKDSQSKGHFNTRTFEQFAKSIQTADYSRLLSQASICIVTEKCAGFTIAVGLILTCARVFRRFLKTVEAFVQNNFFRPLFSSFFFFFFFACQKGKCHLFSSEQCYEQQTKRHRYIKEMGRSTKC